jgi:hypothetical protein
VNLLGAPIHEYILRTDLHDRREEVFGLVDAVHAGGDRQLVQGVVALEVRQVVAEQVQVELLAEAAVGLVLTEAQGDGFGGVEDADFVVRLDYVFEALAWDEPVRAVAEEVVRGLVYEEALGVECVLLHPVLA